MSHLIKNKKNLPTERLLSIRADAGDDQNKHDYYHKVINRYQKILLRAYVFRKRFRWLLILQKLISFIKK